ncbi:hypothetical protein HMPREF9947_1476 [Propionibacterium sp. 409-HC1]|nr:hypothetical protein HMPREF9947_1476 [Propionibacterium sp. 409-HC1]
MPQRVKDVKDWRKRFRRRPGRHDVTTLVELGHQVEDLWTMALRRLTVAEQQTSRDIALWGRDEAPSHRQVVTREQVEQSLADPTAPTSGYGSSWTPGAPCGSGH